MKIVLLVAAWRRLDITRVCYEGICRIQKASPEGFEIEPVIAVSMESDQALAKYYGFDTIMLENKPLARKMNQALEYIIQTYKADYLMQLGSDDLLHVGFWQTGIVEALQKNVMVVGFNRLAMLEATSLRLKAGNYYQGFGAGRLIKMAAIEALYRPLWPSHLNSDLDNASYKTLVDQFGFRRAKYNLLSTKTSDPIPVLDIKSDVNLHKFDEVPGREMELTENFISGFPELRYIMPR